MLTIYTVLPHCHTEPHFAIIWTRGLNSGLNNIDEWAFQAATLRPLCLASAPALIETHDSDDDMPSSRRRFEGFSSSAVDSVDFIRVRSTIFETFRCGTDEYTPDDTAPKPAAKILNQVIAIQLPSTTVPQIYRFAITPITPARAIAAGIHCLTALAAGRAATAVAVTARSSTEAACDMSSQESATGSSS